MNPGFQVVRSDLLQAAKAFDAESRTFGAIMPADGPHGVDGGSAAVNDALTQVLEALGGLHTQMAGVMSAEAGKLTVAAGNYGAAEQSIVSRLRLVR